MTFATLGPFPVAEDQRSLSTILLWHLPAPLELGAFGNRISQRDNIPAFEDDCVIGGIGYAEHGLAVICQADSREHFHFSCDAWR